MTMTKMLTWKTALLLLGLLFHISSLSTFAAGQVHVQTQKQQINDNNQRPPLRRQHAVQIDDYDDDIVSSPGHNVSPTVASHSTTTTQRPTQSDPQSAGDKPLSTASGNSGSSGKRVMLTTLLGSIILPPALRAYGPRLIEEGRVTLDGGKYVGFLRDTFEFTIPSVEPGSYLVDVDFPALLFQPIRVDVNSKGKARGRQVDLQMVRTNEELRAPYPLKIYAIDRAPYFAKREQWRITDIFMNPMVLMMLVPALLMYVVPKMQQNMDPEVRQEMERVQSPMEMMSNLLGGGSSASGAGNSSKPAIKTSAEGGSGLRQGGGNSDEREKRKKRT